MVDPRELVSALQASNLSADDAELIRLVFMQNETILSVLGHSLKSMAMDLDPLAAKDVAYVGVSILEICGFIRTCADAVCPTITTEAAQFAATLH